MTSSERAEEMDLRNLPDFEVRVGDRVFKVWANGRTEGFDEFGAPFIINRILALTRK